jgi:CheY-like chemotaxis protein
VVVGSSGSHLRNKNNSYSMQLTEQLALTNPQEKFWDSKSDRYDTLNSDNKNAQNCYPATQNSVPRERKATVTRMPEISLSKRILVVDDHSDTALFYTLGLEDNGFEVDSYSNPLEALFNFKPNFYDLMLTDINMPLMNGFELCDKILQLDVNVRVCFISAGEVNQESLREWHPTKSIGCFIKKPITIDELVKRLNAELS